MNVPQYLDTPIGRYLSRQDAASRVYDGRNLTRAEQIQAVYDKFDVLASLDEAAHEVEAATINSPVHAIGDFPCCICGAAPGRRCDPKCYVGGLTDESIGPFPTPDQMASEEINGR